MNYVKDYTPILNPSATTISIQAWLVNTENIDTPNSFGEFVFSFVPITVQDHYRLTEAIEQAVWKTEERNWIDPMVQIDAKADCLDRKKNFRCSQLFAPKFNVEDPNADELWNPSHPEQEVSLKLHMRDGPDGTVFLNCDYCDFMSPSNGIEDDRVIEAPGAGVVDEPWDDW